MTSLSPEIALLVALAQEEGWARVARFQEARRDLEEAFPGLLSWYAVDEKITAWLSEIGEQLNELDEQLAEAKRRSVWLVQG